MIVSRRENPYYRLLLASILTSWISGLCLSIDFYPGSPLGIDRGLIYEPLNFVMSAVVLFVPAGLFALFILWPSVLLAFNGVRRIEKAVAHGFDWAIWVGAGTVIGPPAMFLYSYPLGLGRELLADLLMTGACCGAFCAALTRWLVGPEVDDMSMTVEPETSDGAA